MAEYHRIHIPHAQIVRCGYVWEPYQEWVLEQVKLILPQAQVEMWSVNRGKGATFHWLKSFSFLLLLYGDHDIFWETTSPPPLSLLSPTCPIVCFNQHGDNRHTSALCAMGAFVCQWKDQVCHWVDSVYPKPNVMYQADCVLWRNKAKQEETNILLAVSSFVFHSFPGPGPDPNPLSFEKWKSKMIREIPGTIHFYWLSQDFYSL